MNYAARVAAAHIAIEDQVRSLGRMAWERYVEKFGADPDALVTVVTGSVISQKNAKPAAGTVCTNCGTEDGSKAGRAASARGIWYPCPSCGADALARFYACGYTRSDLIRTLFPWSGPKGGRP